MADDLATGSLVALLPDDRPMDLDLFATFLPGKLLPPQVQLFVDLLTETLAR